MSVTETERELLRLRAARLARRVSEPAEKSKEIEALVFTLESERYAFETAYIREVIRSKEVTPLPSAPEFIAGIVNIRGEIVSVVDLKAFFGLPQSGTGGPLRLILLSNEGMEFCAAADAIEGVVRLAEAGLSRTLTTLTGMREDFLKGVAADHTILLDAGKLLSDSRLKVNETA